MANDNNENLDSLNEEIAEDLGDEGDVDVIKQKFVDLTETNKQLFARAKKAEGFILTDGKWVKPAKPEEKPKEIEADKKVEISSTDIFAIIKANVHEEDLGWVTNYAKVENISIPEALKSSEVKTILSIRNETRKTAEATNTGTSRRSNVKISDDVLLDKASKGELPESDEDLDRLVEARLSQKKKK